jgi:hypothetical protein
MFTKKDITNTDSFTSIADVAITENINVPRTNKRKFDNLLSWMARKMCFRGSGEANYAKQLTLTIPNKDEIIFFIKTDFLDHFLHHTRPYLRQKYKIIRGDSDYSIPSGGAGDFGGLLNDSLLVRWYGYNIVTNHPKLKIIPLGIPTKQALELGHEFGDNELFLRELNDFLQNPGQYKKDLIYWGSLGNTTPNRIEIFNKIIKELGHVTITERRSYKNYLSDLKQHKFVICPEGNGIDTLRVWESLHFRAIPIVRKNIYTNFYREDFPILYVDEWPELNCLTEEFLNEEYEKMMTKNYHYKFKFEHWRSIIK